MMQRAKWVPRHKSANLALLRKCRQRAGLTIIELLLSVVLFAGVAVVVLPALGNASQMTQLAIRRGEAYVYGMNKMSELELAYSESVDLPSSDSGRFRTRGNKITPYQWQLTTTTYREDPPLQKVELTVLWPRGREMDSIAFQTILRLRETEE